MYSMNNHTSSLGLADIDIQTNLDLFIHILSAENVTIPLILKYSTLSLVIIAVFAAVLLSIGSYFRYILYNICFHQYQRKQFKPITLLTLFVTVSQHLTHATAFVWYLLIVLSDRSTGYIGGNWFCTFFKNLYRFDLAYAIIGGFGLSVYRILYLKYDHWVKYGWVGEKMLLYGILFIGLALAIVCVVIFMLSDYESTTNDWCMLVPHDRMLQLLDDYEQSRRNPSIYSYWRNIGVVLGSIGILMTLLEISIYICFFHHIYKHDNSERIRLLLDQETIKRRNKKNAVTFFGQFCSFVIEIILMAFLILQASMNWNNAYGIAFVWIKLIGFASISIVEVLTSSTLRASLFERWSFIFPLRSHHD